MSRGREGGPCAWAATDDITIGKSRSTRFIRDGLQGVDDPGEVLEPAAPERVGKHSTDSLWIRAGFNAPRGRSAMATGRTMPLPGRTGSCMTRVPTEVSVMNWSCFSGRCCVALLCLAILSSCSKSSSPIAPDAGLGTTAPRCVCSRTSPRFRSFRPTTGGTSTSRRAGRSGLGGIHRLDQRSHAAEPRRHAHRASRLRTAALRHSLRRRVAAISRSSP